MSKLNNIDDLVNKAFEDFEMSYDASQWDLLQNKMDQMNPVDSFDKSVKESLDSHEITYQPSAWSAVESQLPAATYSYTKWIVAAGIVGLISIGSYFMLNGEENNSETESTQESKKEFAENNVKTHKEKEIVNNSIESGATTEENSNSELVKENSNGNASNNTNEPNPFTSHNSNNGNSVPNNNGNNNNNPNSNNTNITNVVVNTPVVINEPVNSGSGKWKMAAPEINGVTEICSSEEIKYTSSEISNNVTIAWKLNGVEIGSEREITLVNLTPGRHEIELVHSANKNIETCSEPVVSVKIFLNVKESPKVDFGYKQIGDAYYPETKFETLSESEFDNLVWTIDGKTFTGEEAIYIFNKKGNYPVTLEASFENGCVFTESKNIEINNDYNLLAPIAFTPNADGLNDDFIPEALKVLNLPFKMTVYDRNQGFVYQTSRVDAPWTGRNLNTNEMCGQGSYLWVVELTNKKGETELYSGTITLLK